MTFQGCVKTEKDAELHKPHITSTIYHTIFIHQRNFDNLCTEINNSCDFEDLTAKVKDVLNHGKKLSREHVNFVLI